MLSLDVGQDVDRWQASQCCVEWNYHFHDQNLISNCWHFGGFSQAIYLPVFQTAGVVEDASLFLRRCHSNCCGSWENELIKSNRMPLDALREHTHTPQDADINHSGFFIGWSDTSFSTCCDGMPLLPTIPPRNDEDLSCDTAFHHMKWIGSGYL